MLSWIFHPFYTLFHFPNTLGKLVFDYSKPLFVWSSDYFINKIVRAMGSKNTVGK